MTFAERAAAKWAEYRDGLGLSAAPPARPLVPPTHDLRDYSVDIIVKDGGQRLFIICHDWFGSHGAPLREGDFVILRAKKPQGSRYRITGFQYPDIDYSFSADLEFAPRTHEEVKDS